MSTALDRERARIRRATGNPTRFAYREVKLLTRADHRSPSLVLDLGPIGSRDHSRTGRDRRILYLTDADPSPDVRAKSPDSRELRREVNP